MRQWFVVNTKPKNENRASHNLVSAGYDVLNPKLKVRKYREDHFTEVVEAMFPNYIFAKFHPIDDYHMVKYARGVNKIVTFGGKMVPLQEEFIDFIRGKLIGGVARIEKKRFRTGRSRAWAASSRGTWKGRKGP